MATIIYLHGFASVGVGPKSDAIRREFTDCTVHSPNISMDVNETSKIIHDIVENAVDFPIIFVGTSMGGFWANYFAQCYDARAILVNPSLNFPKTIRSKIGIPQCNYYTKEEFTITESMADDFENIRTISAKLYNGKLISMFLAEDDNVIDYKESLEYAAYTEFTSVSPTGGHRYDSEWWRVIDHLKILIKT